MTAKSILLWQVSRAEWPYWVLVTVVVLLTVFVDIGPRPLSPGVFVKELGADTYLLTPEAGLAANPAARDAALFKAAKDLEGRLGFAFIQPVYANGRLEAVIVTRAASAETPPAKAQ